MTLLTELERAVADIFGDAWEVGAGRVIPTPSDLLLGSNHGIKLDATVLYADLDGSTDLVDTYPAEFAAEIYKAYLHCASKIIKASGGAITAYDGDRVMGIFIGDAKNTSAVDAALKINFARLKIINPLIRTWHPSNPFVVEHAIGIDASKIMAARIGVRNDNDIVWVGRAANYAAKLCAINVPASIRITNAVYDRLNERAQYSQGTPMWKASRWREQGNLPIFTSTWMRRLN